MRTLNRANTFLLLQVLDALMEFFHACPMDLGPEMVLGMITVIEKQPVVDSAVAAHAPGYWFIWIRSVMPVVAVKVTKAVPEIPERQKIENNEPPVKQEHHQKGDGECCQFQIPPKKISVFAFAKFLPDGADVITEKT